MDSDIARWDKQEALDIALVTAAQGGHTQLVRLLVNAGANVHAHDCGALMWAAKLGHTEIVDLLLRGGAEARAEDALMRAAKNGQKQTVLYLMERDGQKRGGEVQSPPRPVEPKGPSPL